MGEDNTQQDSAVSPSEEVEDEAPKKKAKLASWSRGRRIMLRRYRRPIRKYIGVISIEGLITPGQSRRPPINIPFPIPFMGSETAGDESVIQMVRLAEKDRQLAALILYVNSPGGVHISSGLMCRQIERLASKKPVVCLF